MLPTPRAQGPLMPSVRLLWCWGLLRSPWLPLVPQWAGGMSRPSRTSTASPASMAMTGHPARPPWPPPSPGMMAEQGTWWPLLMGAQQRPGTVQGE